MTSVHLLTRHSIRNYGSVLQTLATSILLQRHQQGVRLVDYRQPGSGDNARAYAPNRPGLSGRALRVAYVMYRHTEAKRRGELFETFLAKHFDMSERFGDYEELVTAATWPTDDYYCVGSDQVWNIEYNRDNRAYYLTFAPTEAKRFSLASSIGLQQLPRNEENRLKEALQQFNGISVREVQAADYLADLGLKVEQHIDPTLGLTSSEWKAMGSYPQDREPFILVYQLNRNPDLERASALLASKLGLPVVRLEYWNNFRGGRAAKKIIRPEVEEFIGLFATAEFVITDSFHGTAFSTNLGTPFATLMPPKYGARILSFLELVGLEHRLISNPHALAQLWDSEPVLPRAEGRLASERDRLNAYLSRVLSPA